MFKKIVLLFSVLTCINQNLNFCDQINEDVNNVVNIIKENYIDTLDEKVLLTNAISGIVDSLDENSQFFTPDEFKGFVEDINEEFVGIGIRMEYNKSSGTISIIDVIENSPAEKSGLKVGDSILSIGGKSVSDMDIETCRKRIIGIQGTFVNLEIQKINSDKSLTVKIKRDLVLNQSILSKIIGANNNILYIQLIGFKKNTKSQLEKILCKYFSNTGCPKIELNEILNSAQKKDNKEKKIKKIEGIIIDLRYNPGGLLDGGIGCSDLFLDNKVIVQIKNSKNKNLTMIKSSQKDMTNNIPIVVMINSVTASSAEIMAAALQDNDRALLVGTKSYGKGSIQEVFYYKDNAFKITVGRFYSPTGKVINKNGITPNIEVEDWGIIAKRKMGFENKNGQKKIAINDKPTKRVLDLQMVTAIETIESMVLLKKRDLLDSDNLSSKIKTECKSE